MTDSPDIMSLRGSCQGVCGYSQTNGSCRHLVTTAAVLPALALPAAVLPAVTVTPAIDSREAMVARAEQLVGLLGNCYVREGWKLDAERAAQFVESVRTFDENWGECPKFRMTLDWMHDHGQSYDWLFDGDPAGLITRSAAALATTGTPIDAELIALGERLKEASAKADELGEPAHRLHAACWEAGRFEDHSEPRAECDARFTAMANENGYHRASKKWNAAVHVEFKIARAILKIPSSSRVGDGIRAAAAMIDHHDIPCQESPMLWEMAARAGFDPPASIAKDLRRMVAAHARKAVRS
jgi:hypothetical protein